MLPNINFIFFKTSIDDNIYRCFVILYMYIKSNNIFKGEVMKITNFRWRTVFLMVILSCLIFVYNKMNKNRENAIVEQKIRIAVEKGYFIGQVNALNGDMNVIRLPNGKYVWESSPWDNGVEPLFHPSVSEGQNDSISVEKPLRKESNKVECSL